MTTTATETPTYNRIVRETHIVPEHIYARCASLSAFVWPSAPPVKRPPTAPRPGQKPARRKKK